MMSSMTNTRKRVDFRGENEERIASEQEEDVNQAADANQAAESSKGSFIIKLLIDSFTLSRNPILVTIYYGDDFFNFNSCVLSSYYNRCVLFRLCVLLKDKPKF